jgi:hypothetical protein
MLASVLSLALLVVLGLDTKAQPAKEGTCSVTEYHSGTFKVLVMGEERVEMTYEHMGVMINDAGKGFLHNWSVHYLGALHVVKGIMLQQDGSAVYTDPDGDKVFATYKGTGGKLWVSNEGTFTIVGGTRKWTGITGGGKYTWNGVHPAAEGTYQGIGKDKGHWKLP